MATSIISAGDASNLGLQTTGGDDGALVLRSGAAGAKVDALSIAAVGTGAFVGQVTATGFTGTLDGILGSGTAAAATVTTLVTSGIVSVDDTTTSTSGTTGSIHTDGGLGVAGTSTLIGVTTHGDDVVSDTDSTDDLGTTSVRWANLFVDGITATDQITATGFTGTLDGILGSGAAAAATTTTLASTTITASGIIKTDDTTAATSTTDGSLQTDGGLSVAADAVIGDDLFMLSDAAVLTFGADKDVTLTHVADTGILLNSTMVIQFNDASQNIGAPSNAILDINATDEIELNATLIDINGNVDISGTALITGVATHGDDVVSDTDSTDDLGTTGVRWANLFVDAITATDQITATGFTGTLDGILGSGTPAAATVTTIDASGVATATTFEPDGDTAAGDNAAIGYTAAEGLILTGQGSTSDITFKNDADAIVMSIPTGTTNVGIGTTAPQSLLDIGVGSASAPTYKGNIRLLGGALAAHGGLEFQSTTYSSGYGWRIQTPDEGSGSTPIVFQARANTAAWTELLRVTPAGLVGIGTTAPAQILETKELDQTGFTGIRTNNPTSNVGSAGIEFQVDATYSKAAIYQLRAHGNGGGAIVFVNDSNFDTANWAVGDEKMRITPAGRVLIGQTASTNNAGKLEVTATGTNAADFTVLDSSYALVCSNNGSAGGLIYFNYNTSNVGTITTDGSNTTYATSSDYRLKEDAQPVEAPINRLKQLKPINFKWKVNGSRCDGFLAHEAQEIVPDAVTGSKDDLDKEGKPIYQGIDQSKLVPLLTAALQEAVAKIEALETRITTLEG